MNVWRAVDAAALAGTTLRVTGVKRPSSSSFELKWTAVPGASYRVYRASTLSAPFTPLTAVMTAGQGQTMETYTDSSAADPQEFYKVELVP